MYNTYASPPNSVCHINRVADKKKPPIRVALYRRVDPIKGIDLGCQINLGYFPALENRRMRDGHIIGQVYSL